jgi:HEAT repeat protein
MRTKRRGSAFAEPAAEPDVEIQPDDGQPSTPTLLDTLRGLLTHASPDVRRQAIETCATLGPLAAPAAGELLAIYAVEADDLWIEAATALSRIGAAAIAPLAPMLHRPEPQLRRAALEVLGSLCPPESELRPQMIGFLTDEDPAVRHAAAHVLVTFRQSACAAGK